jgi:hypothetical protein
MCMHKIHNCSVLKLIYASMRSTMDYIFLEKIGVHYLSAKFLSKKTFFGSCLGPFLMRPIKSRSITFAINEFRAYFKI